MNLFIIWHLAIYNEFGICFIEFGLEIVSMWELVKRGNMLCITDGKEEYKVGWSDRDEIVEWGRSEVDRRNRSVGRIGNFIFSDDVIRFFLNIGKIYVYKLLKKWNKFYIWRNRDDDISSMVGLVITRTISRFKPGNCSYANYLHFCLEKELVRLIYVKNNIDICVEMYDGLLENSVWCSILREEDNNFRGINHEDVEVLLKKLDKRLGIMFRLRYYYGKSLTEISKIMGISKQRGFQLWVKLCTSNAWLSLIS